MKFIQFIFRLIFIGFNEIIKFSIKRPRISLLLIFGFWLNSLPLPEKNIVRDNPDSSMVILASSNPSGPEKVVTLVRQENKKKFSTAFHHRLEKHFPDWQARIDFQKKQEKFYASAIKKETELKRLRPVNKQSFYTEDELDAIAYFHGTGFYANEQNLLKNPKPSVFDTRQSFLLKMHDLEARNKFLNSFNRMNN